MKRLVLVVMINGCFNVMSGICQMDILKVDILDSNTVFYATKDFVMRFERDGELKKVGFKKKLKIGFNDFSNSMDFVVQDTFMLVLQSYKACWKCRIEEYMHTHWGLLHEYIDLTFPFFRMGILSRPTGKSINIENRSEILRRGEPVEYAFVYIDDEILLVLITGFNIYVYKAIGHITLNQWKFIGQSTRSTKYRNFVAYYEDGRIIVDDMYKGRFEIVIQDGITTKYVAEESSNIVPIYIHHVRKYYTLKRSIVNEMHDKDNPLDFILAQIQKEHYNE